MTTAENLKQRFPTASEIPQEHRLVSPIHQRTYLVGGEFRAWDGECKTVLSPICARQPDGTVQQLAIGSYPVMGEAQSDAALDAAVAAYDLLGALSFNGQRCTALKMLIVHRSIADMFLRRFTEELGKLKVGMPWEPGVNITPLPGVHRTAYMTEAIEGTLSVADALRAFSIRSMVAAKQTDANGPSSSDFATIRALFEAGADVFRLN